MSDSRGRPILGNIWSVASAPLAQLAEQRTLNPRVRGSSPWRRTRPDLGFLHSRSFFACPVCPRAGSMLAREIGPRHRRLVTSRRDRTAAPEVGYTTI